MPPVARIAAVALTILVCAVPAARAAPVLVLPGEWYSIVEPYRYDEARRYEAGWNRGADVVVVDGRVRAPVAGTVRFAGEVAGRTIVTLDARVGGEDVVVTVTGIGSRWVEVGDRVARGEVLGAGRSAHVGAYDPRRRSRYHPVRGAAVAVPAADGTLSSGVAARLEDAILGRTGAATPMLVGPGITGHGLPASGVGSARPGMVPELGGGSTLLMTPARVVDHVTAPRPARDTSATHAAVEPAVPIGATARTRSSGVAAPVAELPLATPAVSSIPMPGTRTSNDGVRGGSIAVGAPFLDEPLAGDPGSRVPGSPSGAGSRQLATAVADDEVRAASPGRRDEPSWALPLIALVSLLPLLALVHRREPRRAQLPVRPPREPLPVVLPHVRPYAYPVNDHDGSSMLDDIALAWPDGDRGTSPDTEARARARRREPEHA